MPASEDGNARVEPPVDLVGRHAIVTGGGTGIGAAVAEHLARRGADVTICGRTEESLARSAADIDELVGRAAVEFQVADVTAEADVERMIAQSVERRGGLDALVANAGGGGALVPLHLQDAAEFERVVRLNLIGTMLLVKHSVPVFARSGGGSFVAISSIAGHVTHPFFGAYTASKAAVEELMRNAADEYGAAGIRFNAVRPGLTTTELMQFVAPGTPVYESYDQNTPLGGASTPAEVADTVGFLVSDAACRVTGHVLDVDGGHHLRRGPDWSSYIIPAVGGLDVALGRRDPER